MTSDIGFYGGGGGRAGSSYQDANGDSVQVSEDHPLPVTIAGGVTVELPDDVDFNIDGSTVSLTAGTEVALTAGTVVGLASGSVVKLDATQLPLLVDLGSDPIDITGTVTLAGTSTVQLAAGTTVGLASGATVALAANTSVGLAAGATVALAANTAVKVSADSPLPVAFSGTPTVALASGTTVKVTADTPLDVAINGGDPVEIALPVGETLPVSGAVTIGGPVTINDAVPVDVNLVSTAAPVEIKNADGDAIEITGIVDLLSGAEVTVANSPTVHLASDAKVKVDDATPVKVNVVSSAGSEVALADGTEVALVDGTTVELADGTTVALEAGTTVALAPGATVALAAGTEVGIDDSTPIDVHIVSGAPTTVSLTPGTEVALADGSEVTLADGSEVTLAAGATVALAANTTVGVSGEVTINDSTPVDVHLTGTATVAFAAGSTVDLADGAEVTLAAGTAVAVTGDITIDDTTPIDVNVTDAVTIDDTTPLRVNIISGGGGGSVTGTVDIADGAEIGLVDGTEVALAAGSEVHLATGTTVGVSGEVAINDTVPVDVRVTNPMSLTAGTTVKVDKGADPLDVNIVSGGSGGGAITGSVEVTNPTGESLDVHLDAAVALAAGSTVKVDDTTPVKVDIVSGGGGGGASTVDITADGNAVGAAHPLPVHVDGTVPVSGSVTIGNTTGSRVPVVLDEPIDVNIVSGGGGGGTAAAGDIITTPDGDAQLVTLAQVSGADPLQVALAADTEVALADGTTVALAAGTSVTLAAGSTVKVTNVDGETLDVTLDGDVHLAAGTVVGLASGASVKVTADTPLPVAVNGSVSLDGATTVHLATDAAVTLAAGATVALATGTTVGLNVGGSALSAGNPAPVAVQGTVPVSGTVGISGTPNVAVTNTPAVTVSGTPNVAVTNIPTVAVQGTVPVSGNVGITGTPAVTISGTPTVTVASGPGAKVSTGDGDAQLVVVQNYASFPTGSGGGGGVVDTELPAAAALSDTNANPTTPMVGSAELVYNGTTWERARSANAANATTGTGVPAAAMVGYDATNALYRRLLTDTAGNLRTAASAGLALITSATVATAGDVIASTDVSAYNSITIRVAGTGAQCAVSTSNDGTTWSTMPVSITTNYGVGPVNYSGVGGTGGWFSWPTGTAFISFPVTARYVRLQQQSATSIVLSMYGSAGPALVQPVSLPTQRAPFSWSAATGAQALTDVSGMNFVTVHVTAYTSGSPAFQCSNDGTNFVAFNLAALGGGAPVSTVGATGIWAGPVPARYFRFNAGASSTLSGVVEFTGAPIIPFGTNQGTVGLAGGSVTASDSLAASTFANVNALGMLFNGSAWERVRGVPNVNGSSSGIGLTAAGMIGYDATSALYRRVLVDTAGNLSISLSAAPPGSATGGTGKTIPATTSTVLGASQVCKSVTVKAGRFNTGVIYVGWGSAAAASGMELYGGETLSVDAANVNLLYLLATNATDYVTYMWVG